MDTFKIGGIEFRSDLKLTNEELYDRYAKHLSPRDFSALKKKINPPKKKKKNDAT